MDKSAIYLHGKFIIYISATSRKPGLETGITNFVLLFLLFLTSFFINQVSSINIDGILAGNPSDRLVELQSLLDPVTFCQFTSSDLRNNTVDSGN